MKTNNFQLVIFLTFSFVLLTSTSNAQSPNWLWAKSSGGAGNDQGYSVATDNLGNSYVAGNFGSSTILFGTTTLTNANTDGSADMFLAKYDVNGNVLWAKSAGGTSYEETWSVTTDDSGNVFVAGDFASSSITFGAVTLNTPGMFLVKYKPNGAVQWAEGLTGGMSNSVITDHLGNSYVTGTFNGTRMFGTTTLICNGVADLFLVKYDVNGNVLWANNAGGTGTEQGQSVAVDSTGNIFITGFFNSPTIIFGTSTLTNANSGTYDMFVLKYDVNGNTIWAGSAGGNGSEAGNSVSTDTSGNIYCTGNFTSTSITFGSTILTNASAGTNDVFIVKYAPNGNILWANSAGGNGYDNGRSIKADGFGNIYVTGNFGSTNITFGSTVLTNIGADNIFLANYDATGNVIWAKSAGTLGSDIAMSVAVDDLGNIFVTGEFSSDSIIFNPTLLTNALGGNQDIFITKLNTSTRIEVFKSENIFEFYPNPSCGKISIDTKINNGEISICNVMGEIIYFSSIQKLNGEQIDISENPKGIYFVTVKTESKLFTQKMVIQ